MDIARIDDVIQYVLAIAGEEENLFDRELGPIHIVKYVYLADLSYAEHHGGETYTGAPWIFWSFGPWTTDVFKRIELAAAAAGAQLKRIPRADESGEFVSYLLYDKGHIAALERRLPGHVTSAIRVHVRKYKKDTPKLLDYVYSTRPMLGAAPGGALTFESLPPKAPPPPPREAETAKQLKRRKERAEEVKQNVAAKMAARLAERNKRAAQSQATQKPPRYDQVFAEGVSWLDSLAGEPIEAESGTLEFSDEVWHSSGRGGPDDAG